MLSLIIGAAQAAEPAQAGRAVFPPFDFANFSNTLFWLILAFGGLYWLMSRIALPRVAGIIETREAKIEGDLRAAAKMQEKAESAGAAYEKLLADAKSGAQASAQQARDSATAAADEKRRQVEAETQAQVQAAEARIAAAREQAMTNVADIATEAAAAIVARITGVEPSAEDVRRAVAKA